MIKEFLGQGIKYINKINRDYTNIEILDLYYLEFVKYISLQNAIPILNSFNVKFPYNIDFFYVSR